MFYIIYMVYYAQGDQIGQFLPVGLLFEAHCDVFEEMK